MSLVQGAYEITGAGTAKRCVEVGAKDVSQSPVVELQMVTIKLKY